MCWDDVDALRRIWQGPLIVKGVMHPTEAQEALAHGVDALVVSNHGGRQLDGAPSTISALPAIVDAVQGRAEVLFDSGVRSGQDILRARALGASAVLAGRAWLYGIGALGERGVSLALDIIKRELAVTMALTGCNDVRTVERSALVRNER
jgi:L-lactate dehydrogenase (cytochrome)